MSVINNAVHERLVILDEELAESIQSSCKAKRHGLDSRWRGGPTNKADLERELGQVLGVVELLIEAGDLDREAILDATIEKLEQVQPFLHVRQNIKLARQALNRLEEKRRAE